MNNQGDAMQAQPGTPLEPIRYTSTENMDVTQPDGGLRPAVGVQNIQVLRTNANQPEHADGDGWTYAHHQDLAVWKGRLYAAWAMTPREEDDTLYKVVYATSADGFHWSAPADLFPRQVATACRFYFYRAANGRMLAFCAGKPADGDASEAAKKVLLVREITTDHRLGDAYTLIMTSLQPDQPPSFEAATDAGFVAACREAAGNNLLLEQQDYGVYLGDRRMKWHDDPELNSGEMFGFGKAFCFYHRQDETLVGLCKLGYATLSDDNGQTWSRPVQPPSLLAGPGKIWGQRTADGRFALAYNPDPGRAKRYPLVIVHGDDGREFRDMRVIHGELVSPRYARRPSSIAYMRGLAEWADDGTFADTKQALWLVYSVSSTPRDNVTVFNPVGMVEAQRTEPGVLVHTIDLSHAVLHWSERLEDGRALARRYGDRVGYVYSTREDTGLFWSNDPALPIGVVLRELRLETMTNRSPAANVCGTGHWLSQNSPLRCREQPGPRSRA